MVAWIKRMLRVEKTGHSGTLDPKVCPLWKQAWGGSSTPLTGDGVMIPSEVVLFVG